MYDPRSGIREPMDFDEGWARFMIAEERSLMNRAQGILAHALARALPGESQDELDRWAEEDRSLARDGLVELMDDQGEIYHRHIEQLRAEDVADRLRAQTARMDWLGWVEVWRNSSGRRRDLHPNP